MDLGLYTVSHKLYMLRNGEGWGYQIIWGLISNGINTVRTNSYTWSIKKGLSNFKMDVRK